MNTSMIEVKDVIQKCIHSNKSDIPSSIAFELYVPYAPVKCFWPHSPSGHPRGHHFLFGCPGLLITTFFLLFSLHWPTLFITPIFHLTPGLPGGMEAEQFDRRIMDGHLSTSTCFSFESCSLIPEMWWCFRTGVQHGHTEWCDGLTKKILAGHHGSSQTFFETILLRYLEWKIQVDFNPILGGGHHPPHFQFYTSKIFFESLNYLWLLSASYYA